MGRHAASGKFQALTRTTAQPSTAGLLSAGGALNAPLGMTLAPRTPVKNGAGDLFGIIITTAAGVITVNDEANILELFRS